MLYYSLPLKEPCLEKETISFLQTIYITYWKNSFEKNLLCGSNTEVTNTTKDFHSLLGK